MDLLLKLHGDTFKVFKKLYVKKAGSNVQADFNKIWNENVKSKLHSERLVAAEKLLMTYQTKITVTKSKNLLNFFSNLNSEVKI